MLLSTTLMSSCLNQPDYRPCPNASFLAVLDCNWVHPISFVLEASYTPALSLPLKLGDVNLNDFPNILAIVVPQGQSQDRTPNLAFSVFFSRRVPLVVTRKGEAGWR
jgi:hypothetical protein